MPINFETLRSWMHFDDASEFLALFAFFEHELKWRGYANAGRERRAEPNWNKFMATQAHQNAFDAKLGADAELKAAFDRLRAQPPKYQMLDRHDALVWVDTVVDNTKPMLESALRLVKAVRNNLFHGGKYAIEDNQARNEQLIYDAQAILTACLDLDPNFVSAPT